MEIVNGHTGQAHILPVDVATMIKMFVGDGSYVLPYGDKLACTRVDAYTVQIASGYMVAQGRMAVVRPGQAETFYLRTTGAGANNKYRAHLIVCEYSINNGIESMILKDLAGPICNTSTTTDPTLTNPDGDMDSGQTVQIPLFRVKLNGTEIPSSGGITRVTPIMDSNPVSTINSAITEMQTGLAQIETNANTIIQEAKTNAQTYYSKWKSFYYQKGSTIKFTQITPCYGFISNSSKDLYFNIPTKPVINGKINLTNLYIKVLLPTGGYAHIVNANTDTSFANWVLVASGSTSPVPGISKIDTWTYIGNIKIRIRTTGSWLRSDGKTKALNSSPVAVMVGNDSVITLT